MGLTCCPWAWGHLFQGQSTHGSGSPVPPAVRGVAPGIWRLLSGRAGEKGMACVTAPACWLEDD